MAIEQIIQAVLAATPAKRARVAAVLKEDSNGNRTNDKRETRLITISGAAKLLSLGRSTIYRLIETGRLDVIDLNGSRRITMKSMNDFLEGSRPANNKTKEIISKSKERYAAAKEVRQ